MRARVSRRKCALKKRLGDTGEFAGDVVFAVILGVVKDGGKNLFGQEVLNQHLAHVGPGQVWVDGLLHEFQEPVAFLPKSGVFGGLGGDGSAQVL